MRICGNLTASAGKNRGTLQCPDVQSWQTFPHWLKPAKGASANTKRGVLYFCFHLTLSIDQCRKKSTLNLLCFNFVTRQNMKTSLLEAKFSKLAAISLNLSCQVRAFNESQPEFVTFLLTLITDWSITRRRLKPLKRYISCVWFCVWSQSLWLAYFLNSCICCRGIPKKCQRKMVQYGSWVWQSRGWTFHMTTVWAAELAWLLLCESCFVSSPKAQTPFIIQQTVGGDDGRYRRHSPTLKIGDSSSQKLKGFAEIRGGGGGEEGQVPSCGLRLSWVMKEPPPPLLLLPLEKLTGNGHTKTWLSPASHFAKDSCRAEGKNCFYESYVKKPYHSVPLLFVTQGVFSSSHSVA